MLVVKAENKFHLSRDSNLMAIGQSRRWAPPRYRLIPLFTLMALVTGLNLNPVVDRSFMSLVL